MAHYFTPRHLEALRYLARDPSNPIHPDQVEAGTLGMLRRRGLVGRVVVGRGRGQRTTSPLTAEGRALLAGLAAAHLWSVTMANHLHDPRDPSDETAHFHRTFPGATREDAHAAAVAYGTEQGDCSPAGGVEDVEGPLGAEDRAVLTGRAGAVPQ